MKIAIEGCAHGDLDKIYETIQHVENQENIKVDLLICCGDFQATRNKQDLICMAVPPKYRDMCSFYKYYSGEKQAPMLTIFIGGNHEASNYLQELGYGGWAAPNIYYLGYAGVVKIGGVRIAGLSGIFKGRDYMRGHFEKAPYTEDTKRSVYHIRNLEVFRLKQLTQPVDIVLSHDWPRGITEYGDTTKLLKRKRFLENDIRENRLGSEPAMDLLHELQPAYWFAAHLHCKYPAIIPHGPRKGMTRFLALDKCLPKRKFLQIIDVEHDSEVSIDLCYDLEWLTILYLTNHLLSVKPGITYMPGKSDHERWKFTPTEEEKDHVLKRFCGDLKVPLNFKQSAPAFQPESNDFTKGQARAQTNPQTTEFCERLGIDDPLALLLVAADSNQNDTRGSISSLSCLTPDGPSDYSQVSYSADEASLLDSSLDSSRLNSSGPVAFRRLSMSLPPPKCGPLDDSDFLSLSFTSQESLPTTQEVTQESSSGVNDSVCTSQSEKTQEVTMEASSKPNDSNALQTVNSEVSAPKKFKRRNQALYTSVDDD